jgi:hypothetical protein
MSMLNYFETPEPFFDYTYSNKKDMNILIVENKDTWLNIPIRECTLPGIFEHSVRKTSACCPDREQLIS